MIESIMPMIPHDMLSFGSRVTSFGEVEAIEIINTGVLGWDNAQHVMGKIVDGSYKLSQACLMLFHAVRNVQPGESDIIPQLQLLVGDNVDASVAKPNYIYYTLLQHHMKGYNAEQIALVNRFFGRIEDFVDKSLNEFTQGHFDYLELDHG